MSRANPFPWSNTRWRPVAVDLYVDPEWPTVAAPEEGNGSIDAPSNTINQALAIAVDAGAFDVVIHLSHGAHLGCAVPENMNVVLEGASPDVCTVGASTWAVGDENLDLTMSGLDLASLTLNDGATPADGEARLSLINANVGAITQVGDNVVNVSALGISSPGLAQLQLGSAQNSIAELNALLGDVSLLGYAVLSTPMQCRNFNASNCLLPENSDSWLECSGTAAAFRDSISANGYDSKIVEFTGAPGVVYADGVSRGQFLFDITNGGTDPLARLDASTPFAGGNAGAAPSPNLQRLVQSYTLNSATAAITVSPPAPGEIVTLVFTQDGTGGRLIDWSGVTVNWGTAGVPLLNPQPSSVTVVRLLYLGNDAYQGIGDEGFGRWAVNLTAAGNVAEFDVVPAGIAGAFQCGAALVVTSAGTAGTLDVEYRFTDAGGTFGDSTIFYGSVGTGRAGGQVERYHDGSAALRARVTGVVTPGALSYLLRLNVQRVNAG